MPGHDAGLGKRALSSRPALDGEPAQAGPRSVRLGTKFGFERANRYDSELFELERFE
jgi:hypothetical protein